MALSKDDILNAVGEMTVVELVDLISAFETKFNVSAAAATASAGPAVAVAVVEEQTEFNVILTNFGANKVSVIKVVRELTGLGLKEAKDLVEAAPKAVKEGVNKDEAADIKKKLEAAGATADVK